MLHDIIYIGTPEFAVAPLKELIKAGFKPKMVISELDRPKGRGKIVTPPPVKTEAIKNKIEVIQPKKIISALAKIKKLKPDTIIVCAYGQIIPKEILDLAKFGVINIHPSLLPKYRGATPIQAAILGGDKFTGVTIMKMDEFMDHGEILSQEKIKLSQAISYQDLADELSILGSKLLTKTLKNYLAGKIKPKKQNHTKATFTKLFKKSIGEINWQENPKIIERKIRAFYPWPGSWTIIDKVRIIITKAHLDKNKLIIDELKPEGKSKMSLEAFTNGYPQLAKKIFKLTK